MCLTEVSYNFVSISSKYVSLLLTVQYERQTWSQGHNMQSQGQGLDLQGLIPEANVGYRKNYKSIT